MKVLLSGGSVRIGAVVISLVVFWSGNEQAGRQQAGADGVSRPAQHSAGATRGSANLLPGGPTEQDYPRLHNLLQVTQRIYSGGQPGEEQAFADLAKLGVRTLVSVDGARPDTAAAARHGLRYVHIPIGYDGVGEPAGKAIARLVEEAEGPFYIHCHHGKHRGPAAAAIAGIADRAADAQAAVAVLHRAGTGSQYAGLWRDVAAYAPPAAGEPLPQLVEVAEVDALVAAMTQIDRATEHLKLCQNAHWRSPPDHPDLAAVQEALLLKEGYHETVRQLQSANAFDERFLRWMSQAEQTAAALHRALERADSVAAAKHFQATHSHCTRCHHHYRD